MEMSFIIPSLLVHEKGNNMPFGEILLLKEFGKQWSGPGKNVGGSEKI